MELQKSHAKSATAAQGEENSGLRVQVEPMLAPEQIGKRFAAQGARVAIAGRERKTLDHAVREIGPGTLALQADVTDLSSVEAFFQEIKSRLGNIDVLFFNAGVARFAPIDQVTVEDYNALLDTNLKGSYFTIQKALPLLNDGASIVLTTTAADNHSCSTVVRIP